MMRIRILYFILAAVLWGSVEVFWVRHRRNDNPAQTQDPFSRWLGLEGSYFDLATGKTIEYRAHRAYLGGPLMLLAGMLAGLLGIGAGAAKVLIHDLVWGLPPKVSTTTSNVIIGVTALAGPSVYPARGLIQPGTSVPVTLGVLAGAFAGTRILLHLPDRGMRILFIALLALLGIEILFRGWTLK